MHSGTGAASSSTPNYYWGANMRNNGGGRASGRSQGPRARTQGPQERHGDRQAARGGPPQERHAPRMLGYLEVMNDEYLPYFELDQLLFCHQCLTEDWWILQGGEETFGTSKLIDVFLYMEVDQTAIMDCMALLQQGASGRALFNGILWDLLSWKALTKPYLDLSSWLTNRCNSSRKYIDRPPADHKDRGDWTWEHYSRYDESPWSPSSLPQEHPHHHGETYYWDEPRVFWMGPGRAPLPPPRCWEPPADMGPWGP